LLPLYSPRNRMKGALVSLFDDRRMDAHSTRDEGRSLFARATGNEASALLSRVGRPNVLSLMLMLAAANATHSRRFLHYDATATAPSKGKRTNRSNSGAAPSPVSPLGHCAVRYMPVADRITEVRLEHQRRAELEKMARFDGEGRSGGGAGSSAESLPTPTPFSEPDPKEAAEEAAFQRMQRTIRGMAGLTNFKGYVSRRIPSHSSLLVSAVVLLTSSCVAVCVCVFSFFVVRPSRFF